MDIRFFLSKLYRNTNKFSVVETYQVFWVGGTYGKWTVSPASEWVDQARSCSVKYLSMVDGGPWKHLIANLVFVHRTLGVLLENCQLGQLHL